MGEWFSNNPDATSISWPAFTSWYVLVRHAKLPQTKLNAQREILGVLAEKSSPSSDMQTLFQGLTRREYAAKVAEVALKISDGDYTASFDDIQTLLSDYGKAVGRLDIADSAQALFSAHAIAAVNGPGLHWRLSQSLGMGAGPIRRGDLVVFGKRPDAGGTTFVASEATFMVDDLAPWETVEWFDSRPLAA